MADISPAWLTQRLPEKEILDVTVQDMSGAGGLNCLMVRLTIKFADNTSETVVLKRIRESGLEKSRELGLAREALFYSQFKSHPTVKHILPTVLHAWGDLISGHKEIIMEDLTKGIQCGYFFGPGSPLNWDKDLVAATRGLTAALPPVFVAKLAARAAAHLHAAFWKDTNLKGDWIRGISWIPGRSASSGYVASTASTGTDSRGEDLWEVYQRQCREDWESLDFSTISWDPQLRACIDASIQRAKPDSGGFEVFRRWMSKDAPWSLVHGDFHPANCMLVETDKADKVDQDADLDALGRSERFQLLLLDWENVGIGSGPQEIGQFLISHMDPTLRTKVEKEVVEVYYKCLVSANPRIAEDMTFEQCWREYIIGGAGKWVWFMPLLAKSCPPKMTQYFHDQLQSFLKTHGLTPETMPMPRT